MAINMLNHTEISIKLDECRHFTWRVNGFLGPGTHEKVTVGLHQYCL